VTETALVARWTPAGLRAIATPALAVDIERPTQNEAAREERTASLRSAEQMTYARKTSVGSRLAFLFPIKLLQQDRAASHALQAEGLPETCD
jgi:hypothetical protein